MPKRKTPPLPAKEQFKKFVESVRKHEMDETGEAFERAFKKIAKPTSPRKSASRGGS